ncbi:hypothetical protein GCM10027435_23100 [Haloparvum alkalitolerans]|uniref:hypothetical protein n=1 Tax=Haloparvum alkalitolerans TaxID=1042953 RepID=UPI003CF9B2E5
MTTSRSRPSDAGAGSEPVGGGPVDESPELNAYELNVGRTVLTEPGNTDGWIATDTTVSPPE